MRNVDRHTAGLAVADRVGHSLLHDTIDRRSEIVAEPVVLDRDSDVEFDIRLTVTPKRGQPVDGDGEPRRLGWPQAAEKHPDMTLHFPNRFLDRSRMTSDFSAAIAAREPADG